jgi:hypothetical protein
MTTLESLFEAGLVDRLRGQYESVDVHAVAAQVRDMAKRKGVRNPNGLLVKWVRDAARQQALAIGTATSAGRDEQRRYADFHAALYREVALEQLGPREISRRLELARGGGYARLNPFVIDALAELGEHWPGEA